MYAQRFGLRGPMKYPPRVRPRSSTKVTGRPEQLRREFDGAKPSALRFPPPTPFVRRASPACTWGWCGSRRTGYRYETLSSSKCRADRFVVNRGRFRQRSKRPTESERCRRDRRGRQEGTRGVRRTAAPVPGAVIGVWLPGRVAFAQGLPDTEILPGDAPWRSTTTSASAAIPRPLSRRCCFSWSTRKS